MRSAPPVRRRSQRNLSKSVDGEELRQTGAKTVLAEGSGLAALSQEDAELGGRGSSRDGSVERSPPLASAGTDHTATKRPVCGARTPCATISARPESHAPRASKGRPRRRPADASSLDERSNQDDMSCDGVTAVAGPAARQAKRIRRERWPEGMSSRAPVSQGKPFRTEAASLGSLAKDGGSEKHTTENAGLEGARSAVSDELEAQHKTGQRCQSTRKGPRRNPRRNQAQYVSTLQKPTENETAIMQRYPRSSVVEALSPDQPKRSAFHSREPCILRLRISPPSKRDASGSDRRYEEKVIGLQRMSDACSDSPSRPSQRQTAKRRHPTKSESLNSEQKPEPRLLADREKAVGDRCGTRSMRKASDSLKLPKEQRVSAQLRKKLAAMDGTERVTLWHRKIGKIVSGRRAPLRKNLSSFLRQHPDHEVFDAYGIHKKRPRTRALTSPERCSRLNELGPPSISLDSSKAGTSNDHVSSGKEKLSGVSKCAGGRVRHGTGASSTQFVEGPVLGESEKQILRQHPRKSVERQATTNANLVVNDESDSEVKKCERSQIRRSELSASQAAVEKEADRLRRDVFTVLGSLRVGDPVGETRRDLETEIQRAGGFDIVVNSMRDGKFTLSASSILADLEALDVYGIVEECQVLGFAGFSDLKRDLENGAFICMEDVWRQYCVVLAHLLDFFEDGSARFYGLERMLFDAGSVMKSYSDADPALARQEAAFLRMRSLCTKALDRGAKMGIDLSTLVAEKCAELGLVIPNSKLVNEDRDAVIAFIEQQQAFLTLKSNYRDKHGYSHLGKQQSTKVLSLSLYRPGYDGHFTAVDCSSCVHETACHCCRRHVEDAASNALCCANVVYGLCRKIFCFQCAVSTFALSSCDFDEARGINDWCCYHCRSRCPKKSHCRRSAAAQNSSLFRNIQKRRFCIRWNHSGGSLPTEFRVAWSLRDETGSYGSFCDPVACTWESEQRCFIYEGNENLGSYRCKVFSGTEWIASFSFSLTASAEEHARSGSASDDRPVVGHASVRECAQRPPKQTCVRWVVAKDNADHDVSTDRPVSLAGSSISTCSRTEGYNWRAAKLSSTVKWVGKIFMSEDHVSHKVNTPWSGPAELLPHSPRPIDVGPGRGIQSGMCISKWDLLRNTFLYEAMCKRSRWCIITGRSGIHGIGLFTLAGFSKGDFVIEYIGEIIRHQVGDIREINYEASGLGTYLFRLNDDQIVDATMRSNRARFINHSCDPNMQSTIVPIESGSVVIFEATRRIPPLAELTFNYQLPLEDKKLTCRCNTAKCAGVMN